MQTLAHREVRLPIGVAWSLDPSLLYEDRTLSPVLEVNCRTVAIRRMRSLLKFTNASKAALAVFALAIFGVGFLLGTHRHTGILRALVEAKHFLSDVSISAGAQQQKTTRPPGPQHKVTLSWKASASAIVGYNLYRRGASGVVKLNLEPVPGTTYVDSTVQAGQTYFYVTKAVSPKGTESTPSNEVRVDIPQ